MKAGGSISIWFFIGTSLFVNGLLILGTGIYELVVPPAQNVVLSGLHANIWWGAILTGIGGFYCIHYLPGKGRGL